MSKMAYVRRGTGEVLDILGDVEDGSSREAELACNAPAGCDLVALECDASEGDRVHVTGDGVATRVL